MNTFEKIRQLMVDIFQIPESEILITTTQDDLISWDSVGHLNLMLAIEQEFGVTLEVEDLRALTSVNVIVEYLEKNKNVV